MLTLIEMKEIAKQIQFKDWILKIDEKNGVPFLQMQFYDKDSQTGEDSLQKCRKWTLSYFMVPSEIVRTAHLAIIKAFEHEVSEQFKYKGQRIYNPHHDLDILADFCAEKGREMISVRPHVENEIE